MKRSLFCLVFLTALLGIFSSLWAQTTREVPSAYATIQLAINAADPGDIINVAAGTYTGNIQLNKSLTLQSSAGAATTVLDGVTGASGQGTIEVANGVNNVRIGSAGHGFTILGIDGPSGIEKSGIYFTGAHNIVFIEGNLITARGDSAMQGEWSAANTNFVITGNTINGKTFVDENPGGVGFDSQFTTANVPRQLVVFGAGATNVNTQNFTFTNNIVSGICGGYNIDASAYQGNQLVTLDLSGTNNIITGNTFSGYTTSTSAALRTRGDGTYTISGNTFNGSYAVNYTAMTTNSATGLTRTAEVYDNNTFTKAVLVKDNLGAIKYREIPTLINYAIYYASAGDEVYIAAGSYAENVVVNKAITINGAGQNATIIVPATSVPGGDGGTFTGTTVIIVSANNVSISNLTVDGNNPMITSSVTVNGVDIDARNGIVESGDSVWNNLHVSYVTIKNVFFRALYAYSGGSGFHFEHNTVQNVSGSTSSISIFAWASSGVIEYNNVSQANDGIASNHSRGIRYSYNTVIGCGTGIHTDNNGSGGGTADLVEHNTISNCDYGIFTFFPYVNPVVDENSVTGCSVGLFHWGGAPTPGTAYFTDNSVDGQNIASSIGCYITTGDDAWMSWMGNGVVNMSGNTIQNVNYGLILESEAGYSLNVTAGTGSNFVGSLVDVYTAGLGTLTTSGISGSIVMVEAPGKIYNGIRLTAPLGTLHLTAGTYNEDVTINKSITVQGANRETVIIKGLKTAGSAGQTLFMGASNITLKGVTVTRDGNNTTDWVGHPKGSGIGFGQGLTGCLIDDCIVTGNRNGVYLNTTQSHTIKNNLITNNRTGVQLVSNVSNCLIENNVITNNWTLGIVIYNGGNTGSSNNVRVRNNNISGNWYSQVECKIVTTPEPFPNDRYSFVSNWYGTETPNVVNVNCGEPGYDLQIPVEFGGDATNPGGNVGKISGILVEKIVYDPWWSNSTMTTLGSNYTVENITHPFYYPTIQAAITAASPNDVLEVAPGTYLESLVINKPITLKPNAAKDLPVIDGGHSGSVVTIASDGVTLQGFQIQNSGSGVADAGVMLNGFDNCHIIGNTVLNNANGIILAQGNTNEVKQNIVTGNDFYGIALVAETGSTLELNNLSGNGLDAIAVENANLLGGPVSAGSTANVIKANAIISNRDGIFFGENCHSNVIGGIAAADGNSFTATRSGIHLWKADSNSVGYNTMDGCLSAIRMIGSDNTIISNNSFGTTVGNAKALDYIWSWAAPHLCENNTVTGNSFGNNDIQVNNYTYHAQAPYDGPSTDFADMTHLVALNTWPGGSLVAEPYYIYGNHAEVLYVDATSELIKDAEGQTYTAKAHYVAGLRGFSINVSYPKAYFGAATGITAGPQVSTLMSTDLSDGINWIYMLEGTYDGPPPAITGSNVVLFSMYISSLADPTNAWVNPIETMIDIPLDDVLMYNDVNGYTEIVCLGTIQKDLVIDSGEPTMAVIPELSGQPLPTVIPPTNEIDPTTLTLSFGDNYNLDFVKYLIQAQTDPATVPVLGDFSSVVANPIDGILWNNTNAAWEIPNAELNALADGTYEIFFLAVDDAGNSYINPTPWVFIIDKTAPDAITWVNCRTHINANNSVDLEWTGNGSKYDVWCLNYSDLENAGDYPIYNPATFTPTLTVAPDPYNSDDQLHWTQLADNVEALAYNHLPAGRGYYYYYVFAEDASGNIGPVSELKESISYWPGDVIAPFGTVDIDDINALGSDWGTVPDETYETNVGPAVENMRRSRRTPDARLNIEDLMMFAMNYDNTDYEVYDRTIPELNPIRIEMISQCVGDQLIVTLNLGDNNGFVKGLNIPILYGTGLSLLSVESGSVWPESSLLLHRNADNIVELSASTLGDEILENNGLIATLTFSMSGTDSSLELQHMIARTPENTEIEIIDNPQETPSGNEDPESIIPVNSYLGANYPNPFNPTTTIQFGLNQTENVRISIFNSRGQMVKTLVNGVMSAGTHNVVWNGMDNNNRSLGSGLYFYRMETKNYSETKKAILIK